MNVSTLCIEHLQVVHCRAISPLSPLLLLIVVVVEVPLLWPTALQRMLLEVESSAMLLLLMRERVLSHEAVGSSCFRCV